MHRRRSFRLWMHRWRSLWLWIHRWRSLWLWLHSWLRLFIVFLSRLTTYPDELVRVFRLPWCVLVRTLVLRFIKNDEVLTFCRRMASSLSVRDVLLKVAERELILDVLRLSRSLIQCSYSAEPGRLLLVCFHMDWLVASTFVYLYVSWVYVIVEPCIMYFRKLIPLRFRLLDWEIRRIEYIVWICIDCYTTNIDKVWRVLF